jgi:hypothetical protein
MDKLIKALKSRTVWTVVLLFVINGVDGIRDVLTEEAYTSINTVLSILAVYFRVNPRV